MVISGLDSPFSELLWPLQQDVTCPLPYPRHITHIYPNYYPKLQIRQVTTKADVMIIHHLLHFASFMVAAGPATNFDRSGLPDIIV